jgi:hypothetical protein
MPSSPAGSDPARLGDRGKARGEGGLLSAPVAEAFAGGPGTVIRDGLSSGGCFARQLPLDRTCASAARRFFREAVAGISLPPELVHDGVTMASELAANTLHAQGNVEFSSRQRPVSGLPELWLYLRGGGPSCELVCKVFDSEPSWRVSGGPYLDPASPEQVGGRGLQVVAGLSAGRWGQHPTRGRLGSWKVPGKAVWFALRVPPAANLGRGQRRELSTAEAVDELASMLADRGLGARLLRLDEPTGKVTVLSISRYLTVWRQGSTVSWKAPAGGYRRQRLTDLEDMAEQIISTHEELALASGS